MFIKRIVQANIKKKNSTGKYKKTKKHQTSVKTVKNVIFMSAKTVINIVCQKGKILNYIFAIEVAFSS